MIAPSIWLSIALLKADLSCCSKRLKMLTVWEVKWRLWHLSKKRCITFKSESEAPYTARPYVRMGRSRILNKWSISFWLKSSFCKLESDVLAKFTIRLKSQSEQYKAITLRNVTDGSVLMACTATFLLSKYQFFTLARFTQHLIIYTPAEKLIYQVSWRVWILPYRSYYSRVVSIFEKHGGVVHKNLQVIEKNIKLGI